MPPVLCRHTYYARVRARICRGGAGRRLCPCESHRVPVTARGAKSLWEDGLPEKGTAQTVATATNSGMTVHILGFHTLFHLILTAPRLSPTQMGPRLRYLLRSQS